MTPAEMIGVLIQDAFWSAIASVGFAVLFNVPRRWLVYCALLGALGHAVRRLLILGDVSIEIGTLVGALLVGFGSYYLSRRLHAPSPIFGIPGSIPLVPGRFAYEAMIGFLQVTTATSLTTQQTLLAESGVNVIKTAIILAAIAIGIAFPSLVFDREKPVA